MHQTRISRPGSHRWGGLVAAALVVLGTLDARAGEVARQQPDPAGKPEPAIDLAHLGGDWTCYSSQVAGEKLPTQERGDEHNFLFSPSFRGPDLYEARASEREPRRVAGVKLDPATSPRSIDLIPADGTETVRGIYLIDGDTLILCLYADKRRLDRPRRFESTPESSTVLMFYERKPARVATPK